LFADSIYHSYAAGIHTAKAILLENNIACNTHHGIISDFDKHYKISDFISGYESFSDFVIQINKQSPSKEFAEKFIKQAKLFNENAQKLRKEKLDQNA
jgi:sulfite reductase (ferredoxin)